MRKALGGATAGLLAAGLAACSGAVPAAQQSQQDDPVVMDAFVVPSQTIEQLLQRSDIVVRATLADDPRQVKESELSKDGSAASAQIPMLVYKAAAESVDVLKGEIPADLEIARYDVDNMVFDQQGSTPVNTPVVLFLSEGPTGVYGVVGIDDGLAIVSDSGQLVWRVPAAKSGNFPDSLEELRALISR